MTEQADPVEISNTSEPPETAAETSDEAVTLDGVESASESLSEADTDDPEQFPREYVQQLRRESAGYRKKAQEAEEEAKSANAYADGALRRLHTELVRRDGRLADPADLEFSVENMFDEDALTAAIDALLEVKPHLRSRRPIGDVGQGVKGSAESPSLLSMLKSVI